MSSENKTSIIISGKGKISQRRPSGNKNLPRNKGSRIKKTPKESLKTRGNIAFAGPQNDTPVVIGAGEKGNIAFAGPQTPEKTFKHPKYTE